MKAGEKGKRKVQSKTKEQCLLIAYKCKKYFLLKLLVCEGEKKRMNQRERER